MLACHGGRVTMGSMGNAYVVLVMPTSIMSIFGVLGGLAVMEPDPARRQLRVTRVLVGARVLAPALVLGYGRFCGDSFCWRWRS